MHPAALYHSYRAEPLKRPEPQRFSGFSLFGVCAGFPEGDTKGDTWAVFLSFEALCQMLG